MLDGIFIGATRGADMRNMMMISLMIYVGRCGPDPSWETMGYG